jgi:hypothetical protein
LPRFRDIDRFIVYTGGRFPITSPPQTGAPLVKKDKKLPPPYVAETKDARFAGTFEVLVPVPDRIKPHRVASQFPTKHAAEGWLHSDEGKEAVAQVLDET